MRRRRKREKKTARGRIRTNKEERKKKERERRQSHWRREWGARVTPGKPKQTGLLCVGVYDARRSVACGEGRTLTLHRTHRCLTHGVYRVYGVAGEKPTGLL